MLFMHYTGQRETPCVPVEDGDWNFNVWKAFKKCSHLAAQS
jgi:hypothetical protein